MACAGRDPPAWIWFDGRGLRDYGYYCVYNAAIDYCESNLVIYDGAGLRSFTGRTPPGFYCSVIDLSAVWYDGTGLTVRTVYRMPCIAA
jgi:hypothetical protein